MGRKNRKISEWSADFVRLSQGELIDSVVIDPSAKRKEGDQKSILAQFEEVLNPPGAQQNFRISVADNDRGKRQDVDA
jgi:hypothetical protein